MAQEHGATNPRSFALTPENQPKLAEIARAIHAGGALASHELNHGGNRATREANHGGEDWMPWGPVDTVRWDGQPIHGMTPEEVDLVAEHFADGAELLKNAGYDMVLIHGGHGWLLDQFIYDHSCFCERHQRDMKQGWFFRGNLFFVIVFSRAATLQSTRR